MSCGEPIDYSKPWFAPAGLKRGICDELLYSPNDPVGTEYYFENGKIFPYTEELNPLSEPLTIAEVQERANALDMIEWANTPLSDLPELSDLEYFQRKLWKGLGIPTRMLAPDRRENLVTKAYVDAAIEPGVGQLFLDTATDNLEKMGQVLAYDDDKWVPTTPVAEFEFFDISLVCEPLLDDCRLPESKEDKYDRAMGGIEQ